MAEEEKRQIDIKLNTAKEEDIQELLEDIRQVDIDEIRSSTGKDPGEVLAATFQMPGIRYVLRVKGELVCMYGIVMPNEHKEGIPWMIGTNNVKKYKRQFLDASRFVFCTLCGKFTYLENYVDARNKDSIKWLAWLGFYIEDPVPYGAEKLPFHKFYLVNEHV